MTKIYKKLTDDQKKRGVIFSSTLSTQRTETSTDNVHEILNTNKESRRQIGLLLNDSFFTESPYKYNIIRQD